MTQIIRNLAITVFLMLSQNSLGEDVDSSKPPVDVYIEEVKEVDLFDPMVFGGKILAASSLPVLAEISGAVSKVYVAPGDSVKKGAKLFEIQPIGQGVGFRSFVVRAGKKGIVLKAIPDQGSFIEKGHQATEIASFDQFKISFSASSGDLGDLKTIESFKVELTEGPPLELSGYLKQLSPLAELSSGLHLGELGAKCPSSIDCSTIPLGSLVKIKALKDLRRGIRINQRHVKNNKVMTLNNEDKIEFRPIKIGKNYGVEVEILEGLKVGDRLVTNFARFPKNGETAKIITKQASSDTQSKTEG